jgi:tetratricopeptide (TPR) repeat protein
VLVDFGLAVEPRRGNADESSHRVAGTRGFIAPEQCDRGIVDERSDVYSLGMTLRLAIEQLGSKPPAWLTRMMAEETHEEPARRCPDMRAFVGRLQRRRRWGRSVALGGVAVTLAGAGLHAPSPGDPCESASERAARLVSADTRRQIRAAFSRTDQPYAPKIADTTLAELDRYAAEWGAIGAEQCARARVGTGPPAQEAAARQACLDRREAALRDVTAWLDSVEASNLERSLDAVWGLPPVESCRGAVTLDEEVHSEAQRAVDKARLALASWDLDAVAQQVEESRRLLGPTPDPRIEVEGDLISTAAAMTRGDQQAVTRHATAALTSALEADLPRSAAMAASWLARGALRRSQKTEGDAWITVGDGLMERAAPGPAHRARYLHNLGAALASAGELDRATARLHQALAACESAYGPTARCARIQSALGAAYTMQGDEVTAWPMISNARATLAEALGFAHPAHLLAAHSTCTAALALDDPSYAQRLGREALAATDDPRWRALFLGLLGEARQRVDDPAGAVARLQEAWELSEVLPPSARAMLGVKLADAYTATDDPRAGQVLRTASEVDTPEGDYAALHYGIWLADRGGSPDADDLIERGLAGLHPLSPSERKRARNALERLTTD